MKNEPDWMRKFRHEALDIFFSKPMPTWGADLSGINFDEIYYFLRPMEGGTAGKSWDDVPEDIKRTFDRLGIPEAERKFLAGVGAQYDSEVVYHSLRAEWEKLGVIFLDMDSRLARARGPGARVLRHHHPGGRQQVRGAQQRGVERRLASSTSPRACTSTSRCRPTSASTPRTWASSSAR